MIAVNRTPFPSFKLEMFPLVNLPRPRPKHEQPRGYSSFYFLPPIRLSPVMFVPFSCRGLTAPTGSLSLPQLHPIYCLPLIHLII